MMQIVHLRVNVGVGPQAPATPCRVSIQTDDGRFFTPYGLYPEFPLGKNEALGSGTVVGSKRFFTVAGQCEIPLPVLTPMTISISKGLRWQPIEEKVSLPAGKMALRYSLTETDFPKDVTLTDDRVQFLSPHDALLEAQAEGLDGVTLALREQLEAGQDGKLYPVVRHLNTLRGFEPILQADSTTVQVASVNQHASLGALLLHSHRPVFPLVSGGEHGDDWSLQAWAEQAHRKKGGAVHWIEAGTEAISGGEALALTLFGAIDSLELCEEKAGSRRLNLLYNLWNYGRKIGIVGASGKQSNRQCVGALQTARQAEAGALFPVQVTNGPYLKITRQTERLHVQLIQTRVSDGSVECVADGSIVARANFADARTGLDWPVPQQASWFAVRAIGQSADSLYGTIPFAHTQAVFLPREPDRELIARAARTFLPNLEKLQDWYESAAVYANPTRKQQQIDFCQQVIRQLQGKIA